VKQFEINMKRLFLTFFLMAVTAVPVCGQDNMEAFRHLSVGAEIGLHGFGVEVAMPVQKHFVIKAGYNWAPSGDLFNTDISIDTHELKEIQETYDPIAHFEHKFGDEAIINTGIKMGLTNVKALINWYPFASGSLYLAGGVYYTPKSNQDDPFIELSGTTTPNDWAALKELNDYEQALNPLAPKRELAVKIGDENYPVQEVNGCGYMEAQYKFDPLKYYVGLGLGRCIPNGFMGLQFEVGAMIYHNSVLYCQDKKVGSITEAADGFGNDSKEILEYVDKYPFYPQLTLRLSFRMF
jgi:hypothetical protein